MAIPTEIHFHELETSASAEASIERWVSRLEHVHDRIVRCHVIVSQPHRHSRRREFEVHVRLEVAGTNVVTRFARAEDIYVAIADAFRATRRQLLEDLDNRRGYRAPFMARHATGV